MLKFVGNNQNNKMEIYNGTGKTKTGELRVTRPIGALVVGMSQPFAALTNETITVFIERANGDNTNVCIDFPLAAFIALSTAASPAVFEGDSGLKALCEICEEGAIKLQETESIKIKLDNLKAAVTYSLHGMEYPVLANSVVKLNRKNILSGQTEMRYDLQAEELMLIEGIDNVLEINVAFENGIVCKYVPEELKAISRDFDAVKLVRTGASVLADYDLPGFITYPLVGVLNVDVKKKIDGAINLYLKNDVENF